MAKVGVLKICRSWRLVMFHLGMSYGKGFCQYILMASAEEIMFKVVNLNLQR